jgi:hypothetical protein
VGFVFVLLTSWIQYAARFQEALSGSAISPAPEEGDSQCDI